MSIVAGPPPAARGPRAPSPTPRHAAADRCRTPPLEGDHPAWIDLDQRLPPEHLARRIAQAVAQLDLRPLQAAYGRRGSPPYRPDLLLGVILYELHRGRPRPADWARDARECEPVRWLARGCTPSRSRWYAFRERIAPWLDDWNRQVLQRAQAQAVTPGTRAAVDGSTVAALASRHRLVNEGVLRQRLEQLDQAMAADAAPPADGGATAVAPAAPGDRPGVSPATAPPPPKRPGWMAATLAGRRRQRRRYGHAHARLAEWQRRNQQRRRQDRKPAEKVLVSLGDPEAVLGLDKLKVYRPLYNVQLVTDLDSPLVLAYDVFDQPNDNGLLQPMLERLTSLWGRVVAELVADSSYATGPQLALAEARGVTLYAPWQANDHTAGRQTGKAAKQLPKGAFCWRPEQQTYACPQGHLLAYVRTGTVQRSGQKQRVAQYRCPPAHCGACPLQSACTRTPQKGRMISRSEYEPQVERLQRRMQEPAARALYGLRRQSVERGFADVKEHRGLRRFSGRGLRRVRGEVGLRILVHNLLVLQDPREKSLGRQEPRTPSLTET